VERRRANVVLAAVLTAVMVIVTAKPGQKWVYEGRIT
jgi:hypothetical protein